MYENDCCNEKTEPLKQAPRATTCETASCLLECLRHIDEMTARLNKVLFNSNLDSEKMTDPDCLDANIVIAFDTAKSVARKLESILGKL